MLSIWTNWKDYNWDCINDLTINLMSYFVINKERKEEIDLQIGFILDCKVECHSTKCSLYLILRWKVVFPQKIWKNVMLISHVQQWIMLRCQKCLWIRKLMCTLEILQIRDNCHWEFAWTWILNSSCAKFSWSLKIEIWEQRIWPPWGIILK